MSWIGHKLGGYQIESEIGRGGMAVVYRAYQPQLARWVALKVLDPGDAAGRGFLKRFRREAKAVASLRHPNILTVHDYGEQRGIAYLVMEYVAGGTLKTHLTGQPQSWSEAVQFVIPLAQALAYAHSKNIVHRDVKPANVLLARPDWPLLADFGLVKLLGRRQEITKPGVSTGTPAYFSPEQVAGEAIDHRSDVYSLGILLYELLTSHVPFESRSPVEMLFRRLHEPPAPPRHLNPHISPQQEAVILRALARDPAARHHKMEALVADLSRASGGAGAISVHTTSVVGDHATAIGPRLVVTGTGATLPLPQKQEVFIGRAGPRKISSLDIDLEPHGGGMAGVSRHHARLLRYPDGWAIDDLGSTNGTFVNGVQVLKGQPRRLCGGDFIQCSRLTLVFYEK